MKLYTSDVVFDPFNPLFEILGHEEGQPAVDVSTVYPFNPLFEIQVSATSIFHVSTVLQCLSILFLRFG